MGTIALTFDAGDSRWVQMDDDDSRDMFDSAIQGGLENYEILRLAAAWCQNIGQTTGGVLGVGMLERATGLPITGGSLRCEYASAPTSFGHSLIESSVEFYEANCIGCPHRKPTAETEHLGTYADAKIADRDRREAEAELERLEGIAALERRRSDRRMRFGVPNPTGQSILDLIDRVDGEGRDTEAETLLLRHAEMAPADFTDDLLTHLTDEAIAIGNSPLLESIVAVFERDGRPPTARMLEVAFRAVTSHVAGAACGRVIAAHAEALPDDDALAAVVGLAAGRFDFHSGSGRVGQEPAALLRLFDIDPVRVSAVIDDMLKSLDVSTRADAAHASQRLVAARPAAAPLLIESLLDAVAIPESSRYFGDPFAAGTARTVVGDIFNTDPVATSAAIDRRMASAGAKAQRSYWSCYRVAAPSRFREEPANDAHRVIARRAVALIASDATDPELHAEVADTLESLCRDLSADLTMSFEEAIPLLLTAVGRYEVLSAAPPEPEPGSSLDEAVMANLEWQGDVLRRNRVINALRRSLEHLAEADVGGYIDHVKSDGWAATLPSDLVREALLEVMGKVIATQPELDRATPLLLEAISSDGIRERAAAIEALGLIAGRDLNLPDSFEASVVAALSDRYLLTVRAAVQAVARIQVSGASVGLTIDRVLGFAAAYGPERIYTEDVRTALRTARELAHGQPFHEGVETAIMNLIATFPSAEAAEILEFMPLDTAIEAWPATVIAALKPDPDPQWDGIHERAKVSLLRKLGAIEPARLATRLEEIELIGKQRLPYDNHWAWALSDVLARLGAHERAASVCDAVVVGMPDTKEYGPRRSFASIIGIEHRVNAAVANGDQEGTAQALGEWDRLSGELNADG